MEAAIRAIDARRIRGIVGPSELGATPLAATGMCVRVASRRASRWHHCGTALRPPSARKLRILAAANREKRKFIKGQKYALLSHKENLEGNARKNLKILLAANKRLNTAYVMKESFGQLWDYNRQAWARKFFENWRDQLKWQRLKQFAAMIDAHWGGIAAYCEPENKVPLGFVEGLNNKIRVFQRRAYGLRDEEYLRLKVLSCMLPEI
jgi:transposase